MRASSRYPDSVGRLVTFLARLSPDEVTWDEEGWAGGGDGMVKSFVPTPLTKVLLMPSLWRSFTCPPGCVSCCIRATLDYTPREWITFPLEVQGVFRPRSVVVSRKERTVYTCEENVLEGCPFLTELPERQGCSLWPNPPLLCQALPQIQVLQRKPGIMGVFKKPYGRAWNFPQKPQCQFSGVFREEGRQEDLQVLRRFFNGTASTDIYTVLDDVMRAYRRGSPSATSITAWER